MFCLIKWAGVGIQRTAFYLNLDKHTAFIILKMYNNYVDW